MNLPKNLDLESGRDRASETPKSTADRTESAAHQSELSAGKADRTKVESDRSQTAGFPHHDSKSESGEILSSASALDASKQSAQAKISDRTVFESGHREKSVGSERNLKDNSEFEKSTGIELIQLEVSFSEPTLNPLPSREPEKEIAKNKDREKSQEHIMSR